MKYFFRAANNNDFLAAECIRDLHRIDWQPIQHHHYEIGDIVFLYMSAPVKQLRFMLEIEEVDIPYRKTINPKKYWGKKHAPANEVNYDALYCRLRLVKEVDSAGLKYQELTKHGLKDLYPKELKGELLEYILSEFNNHAVGDESERAAEEFYEGGQYSVIQNRYERDSKAREICIAKHGCRCMVCGFDFEKMYGELGRGFIHVHHIVPISSIGKEYKLDPVKDLVPVCPNCHAMLHHGAEGRVLTVEDVQKRIKM